MRKKRILIHTNAPWMKTGLAENGKILAKHLFLSQKYDLYYYCSQTHVHDPQVQTTPWKSFGCIPADPSVHQIMNQDQGKARDIAYGSYYIDQVIKDNQIDVYVGGDDAWAYNGYVDKPWWNKINSCLHVTVDSLPVLDQALDQASKTKNYFTWTKFPLKEIHGKGHTHVKNIYGVMDTNIYSPISKEQKLHLRKVFNIDPNTVIFGYVFRNQLRKRTLQLLKAFADFKKKNPDANVKIHLHSSYSESGMGWNFPKMMKYFGIKNEDVLCTYVCKNCGKWLVAPYQGEDVNCPFCKAEKSMITPNIAVGVPHEEMKLVYGLWDAGVSCFNSGGLEYHNCNTLLCGLPLASTNYSCGEDFCEQSFVFPLNWEMDFEPGTNFIKAAVSIKSIVGFMEQIYRMPEKERLEIGRKGREWAVKTFSVETIGKQWEGLFDSLPLIDWSTIDLNPPQANPNFTLPENYKDLPVDDYIKLLYREILKREPDQGGYQNWLNQLNNNVPREQVYQFFVNVANQEVVKTKKTDIWDIIDKDRPTKRAIFVIRESLGDLILISQLFESFHEQYPNTDLYICCDAKFAEVFDGNPYVFKVIPYDPIFEQEMAMCGSGGDKKLFDYFFHPAIGTQRHLDYLTANNPAYTLNK